MLVMANRVSALKRREDRALSDASHVPQPAQKQTGETMVSRFDLADRIAALAFGRVWLGGNIDLLMCRRSQCSTI